MPNTPPKIPSIMMMITQTFLAPLPSPQILYELPPPPLTATRDADPFKKRLKAKSKAANFAAFRPPKTFNKNTPEDDEHEHPQTPADSHYVDSFISYFRSNSSTTTTTLQNTELHSQTAKVSDGEHQAQAAAQAKAHPHKGKRVR